MNIKKIKRNYVETNPNFNKNFYAVGHDKEGKNYLTRIDDVWFIQANKEANWWAKKHKLTLDGVYSN
jgi:hypothetical protein